MNWDPLEYGNDPSDTPLAEADEVQSSFGAEPGVPEDQLDEQMTEAEGRLHKAMLYRQFLTGDVFDGSQDLLTAEVEAEFKAFARHQLGILLGVGSASDPFGSPFTEEQVKVLRLMADKTLQNAAVRAEINKPASRSVPHQAAPAPTPKPQPPRLRSRTVAGPAQPAAKAPQRSSQSQRPTPTPQAQPKPGTSTKIVPADEEIIQAGDKRYKVKWVQMASDGYGPEAARQLESLPLGSNVVLSNGVQVVRTVGNEFYKIIRRDLSTQARNHGAMPMPPVAHMSAITAAKSAEQVNNSPFAGVATQIAGE